MDKQEFVKVMPTTAVGVMHIHLNRPAQLNALNHATLEQLLQHLKLAKADRSVKSILLTGEGKVFCAGADINELAPLDEKSGLAFAQFGQAVFNELEMVGKPSLAAIQGVALGGGCELAMAATLRIAASNATFGQPEVKLGVIPGFGGTQRLSRLIGKGRALEACLTGNRMTAQQAFEWGLVNELTSPETLLSRALEIASHLATMAPIALKNVMTAIFEGYDLNLEQALAIEAQQFALCCKTQDKHEGVQAFLEKREAVFSGG